MKATKRYSLKKVFWIVLGFYLFFGLIAMLAISLVPNEATKVSSLFQWKTILKTIISLTFSTLFYYFTVNHYYNLIVQKKKYISYLSYSSVVILISFAYHVGNYFLFPSKETEGSAAIPLLIFGICLNTFFFIALSLLIAYLTNLRDDQKQRKVLEEQKMQLEIEKSQANFNFLKAQINPHFLHNTLNFLYAKSLPYSAELSEGILTLSDIMRYALSEGNAKDGKAPLRDEIEHVRNVIKINQLRFSNNLNAARP